ncbi:MAG: MoaD/ThiS family protein [Moraxellaceae bacterium]|nr:MoaD/ThiS family protein [Moraxellaceae bacterium]
MSVQVLYFARYREAIGQGEEVIELNDDIHTLSDLRQVLLDRGPAWQILADPRLCCSRNQTLCQLDEPITDHDEVAFFPMVTGG